MSISLWTEVDNYFTERLIEKDDGLEQAFRSIDEEGMPPIQVAPNQGKLLSILARSINARSILEIGTLAGYSTIWLARSLAKGGSLVTLEADPHHAEVARANIARAGFADAVEIIVGKALDTLPLVAQRKLPAFDFVFIDADKENNAEYFKWTMKLTHPGSVIVIDNVVREGRVAEEHSRDSDVRGVRLLHDELAAEPRVTATAVQTVGSKGYDGFTIALVTGD
ncbi:MAG TPA: O-methyltransferase [Spirochaetia bacterium]|nr:O-methyltransferase [Spirochaetia bacterium]